MPVFKVMEQKISPPGICTKKVAIFASGTGSNAAKIIEHFKAHPLIEVVLIVCNRTGAGVFQVAETNNIPTLLIEKERFFRGDAYVSDLKQAGIFFIALAGFLWKIPQSIINVYRNRIINIHPALLPAYGGKGMYGAKVHEAVIQDGVHESGITIHKVDEHYDNGDIVFQAKCEVLENDTAESLATKIHVLEHRYFPQMIEECVLAQMG